MSKYATVTPIPAVPSIDALTYHVPADLDATLVSGMRVVVPLGRRRVTGIVTAIGETAPTDLACRDIGAVLDSEPLLSGELLELARWMSEYYEAPFAEVVSLAIGRGLTASSTREIELLQASLARTPLERRVVETLESHGGRASTTQLRRYLGGRSADATLTALRARGAVRIEEHLAKPKVQTRHEVSIELVAVADEAQATELFARAAKRKQVYDYLLSQPRRRISLRRLAEVFPTPGEQVSALEKAGLVRRFEEEVYRTPELAAEETGERVLSDPQREAVDALVGALGAFQAFLLQGVTASGKTEVYLRVIREVLDGGGSALVLVPEISLTHQLVGRLVGRFGPTVAVLHSELTAGQRWDEWRRICRREVHIVVGARSAVLAPLHDLRLIVVDEEHDGAFKQDDGVRYNARDVAVVRARQAGCPVILGSATPSIESCHRAREGKYRRLVLPERVTASPLPHVDVVDLRGRDIIATGGLSEHLTKQLSDNFEKGGQSLLFLNRRGYAACVQCYECGEIVECTNCSVGMTLHRDVASLRCHHCDAVRPLPPTCPSCQADALLSQGLGTQRLEQTVRRLLPGARIARLDRDVAGRRGASRDVLSAWCAGNIDVLIGTQMITKGHDAPGVTLVGVVQADMALAVPDFRAAERTFQLLSQVAGRAGRGEQRGRVIVQTYRPDHFAIVAAVRHDYETFATEELAARGELGYPPYARMALLRFEGRELDAVEEVATAAARWLERMAEMTAGIPAKPGEADVDTELLIRGPAPSPIERIKGRHRYQLQLRCQQAAIVRHAAAQCRRALLDRARRRQVRLLVDIDPVDML